MEPSGAWSSAGGSRSLDTAAIVIARSTFGTHIFGCLVVLVNIKIKCGANTGGRGSATGEGEGSNTGGGGDLQLNCCHNRLVWYHSYYDYYD